MSKLSWCCFAVCLGGVSCSKDHNYIILNHTYAKTGIVLPESAQTLENFNLNAGDDQEGRTSCAEIPNGSIEWRDRFEKDFYLLGKECVKERQERKCVNGTWSKWSGSFVFKKCSIEKYVSIFADTKEECQRELKNEFEATYIAEGCMLGGACGKNCGKPSTNCTSSYTEKFGICLDGSDFANRL